MGMRADISCALCTNLNDCRQRLGVHAQPLPAIIQSQSLQTPSLTRPASAGTPQSSSPPAPTHVTRVRGQGARMEAAAAPAPSPDSRDRVRGQGARKKAAVAADGAQREVVQPHQGPQVHLGRIIVQLPGQVGVAVVLRRAGVRSAGISRAGRRCGGTVVCRGAKRRNY